MKRKILFGLLFIINLSVFAQKIGEYSFVYPGMLDMLMGSANENRGLPAHGTSFKILSDTDCIKDGVKMTECYMSGSKIYMTFVVESEPVIFEFVYKDTGEGNKTAYLIKLTLSAAKKVNGSYQKSVETGVFTEPAGDLLSNARGYGQFYGAANEVYGLIYDWGKKAKVERARNEKKVSQLESKISAKLKEFSKKEKTAMLSSMKKSIEDSIVPFVLSEGVFDKEKFLTLDKSDSEKIYYEYKDKFETTYKKDIEDYKKAINSIEATEKNFWFDEFNFNEITTNLYNEIYDEHKDGVNSQIELRNRIYVDTFAQKGKECIDSIIPEFDSVQTGFDSETFSSKVNDKLRIEYESLEKDYVSKTSLEALKFKPFEEICSDVKISESIESVKNAFDLRDLSYESFVENIKNVLIKQSCKLCKSIKNPTIESIKAALKDFEKNELEKEISKFEENNSWGIHYKSYEPISDKVFEKEILGVYCEENKKSILKLTKQGNAELKKK